MAKYALANQRFLFLCSSLILVLLFMSAGYDAHTKTATMDVGNINADVIVVGGGIAGLAAALELGRGGAKVLILDMNSVAGGHAIKAGGFALVGTPLQELKGIKDDPELAYQDLMAWGETNDPNWTRFYVENSRTLVHDWLAELSVEFVNIFPTPEHSVPRFHFTQGTAANAVIPLIRAVFERSNIKFLGNWRAENIIMNDGTVQGITAANLRTEEKAIFKARATVIATGGYQANTELVKKTWRTDIPFPETLLVGSSPFSLGGGYALGEKAGAALINLHKQVTFVNGFRDPRDPQGRRALTTDTGAAIWINTDGKRFINESAANKFTIPTVLQLEGASFWAVFDEPGKQTFNVRDAIWLTPETFENEIIRNPAITKSAPTLTKLAEAAELPADTLASTVARYNGFVDLGKDEEFGRIKARMRRAPQKIETPPFYAIQIFPVTRKSMGGIAIDMSARALDENGVPVAGLYAAGEVTGAAGINGSVGMSGTFLGPSLMTGRIAGQTALQDLAIDSTGESGLQVETARKAEIDAMWRPSFTKEDLVALLEEPRSGYWHFEISHSLVLERDYECTQCHSAAVPMQSATTQDHLFTQSETCAECHR